MKTKFLTLVITAAVVLSSCVSAKYRDLDDGLYADIQTERGDIILKLYKDDVPATVSNFVSLAEGNNPRVADSLKNVPYYDGITFHRVINDFMVQSGDRTATGRGSAGYRFHDEFPKDSLGKLKYKHDAKGVLSMANSGPGTNSSQFFITHKPTPWLNGKHSVFGKVVKGLDVVDSIKRKDKVNHIKIVRIGRDAKKYDAPKVFNEQMEIFDQNEKARLEKVELDKKEFLAKNDFDKSVPSKSGSGLRVLSLKKGKGRKVTADKEVTVHFTLHTAAGKLIQSTVGKDPFKFTMTKVSLIKGWQEGVLQMRQGDKSRLFIPANLAWGARGGGLIPPNSDVVFDIEILKVAR